jgi:aa3 type cytochrome c oxidase subunit IV
MAAEGDARDFKAHEKSYARFIAMMKWGTILSALTGILVILIISN